MLRPTFGLVLKRFDMANDQKFDDVKYFYCHYIK
jgi:hypothetical protein